jgi:hypothetical protein
MSWVRAQATTATKVKVAKKPAAKKAAPKKAAPKKAPAAKKVRMACMRCPPAGSLLPPPAQESPTRKLGRNCMRRSGRASLISLCAHAQAAPKKPAAPKKAPAKPKAPKAPKKEKAPKAEAAPKAE